MTDQPTEPTKVAAARRTAARIVRRRVVGVFGTVVVLGATGAIAFAVTRPGDRPVIGSANAPRHADASTTEQTPSHALDGSPATSTNTAAAPEIPAASSSNASVTRNTAATAGSGTTTPTSTTPATTPGSADGTSAGQQAVRITANGSHGDGVAYLRSGAGASFDVGLGTMQPGGTASGDVVLANAGHAPITVSASVTGTDTHPDTAAPCFGFVLHEVAASGSSRAMDFPVHLAAFGSSATTDAGTAPFATAVRAVPLPDVGSDRTWETDDRKTYQLIVRALSSCTQGSRGSVGPTGTLRLTFTAATAAGR